MSLGDNLIVMSVVLAKTSPMKATVLNSAIQASSAAPTVTKEKAKQTTRQAYPDYKVIVLNDDFNTFQHVAETLVKYIPHMTPDQAWKLTNQIHHEGQATVWVGPLEQAELYHSQLIRAGLTMAPLEKA
ncbi:ATP-dependent Clp protease adapter ClpS [Leptolyngbya cf. ectocarpi LEGE 11479]|uniref:ATP-dependent Clp protease adapter protein ClpS n=2 Tax=Leptolyngbya ectocarpi TaxID=1202 RepID=A0A928ZVB5_LEPEC|nr:ATP-dependent Clp protease adapter ClpS [Leptolyngbya cf. ectocarpi LEGE 11479]